LAKPVLLAGRRVDVFHMVNQVEPMHRIVLSASALDERDETYMSLLGKLLAAIVAVLWGTSLILAATIGVKPGTHTGLMVMVIGIALILLSLDQVWRVMRKLG
jgi:hypothetical protein